MSIQYKNYLEPIYDEIIEPLVGYDVHTMFEGDEVITYAKVYGEVAAAWNERANLERKKLLAKYPDDKEIIDIAIRHFQRLLDLRAPKRN